MAHLKTSIVEVKAEEICLGHDLVISIAKVDNDRIIRLIDKAGRYAKYSKPTREYRYRSVQRGGDSRIGRIPGTLSAV